MKFLRMKYLSLRKWGQDEITGQSGQKEAGKELEILWNTLYLQNAVAEIAITDEMLDVLLRKPESCTWNGEK